MSAHDQQTNHPVGEWFKPQDLFRVAAVKRWHTVDTCKVQTVAEHAYNVTNIAVYLYKKCIQHAAKRSPDFNLKGHLDYEMLKLVLHCMSHDNKEAYLGDTPGKVKKAFPTLAGIMERAEDFVDSGWMEPVQKPVKEDLVYWIYKIADHMEATLFVNEYGVGRHAEEVGLNLAELMEALLLRVPPFINNEYGLVGITKGFIEEFITGKPTLLKDSKDADR